MLAQYLVLKNPWVGIFSVDKRLRHDWFLFRKVTSWTSTLIARVELIQMKVVSSHSVLKCRPRGFISVCMKLLDRLRQRRFTIFFTKFTTKSQIYTQRHVELYTMKMILTGLGTMWRRRIPSTLSLYQPNPLYIFYRIWAGRNWVIEKNNKLFSIKYFYLKKQTKYWY